MAPPALARPVQAVRSRLTAEAISRSPVDPAGTRWSVRIGWEPRWRHLAGRLAARRGAPGPGGADAGAAVPYNRRDTTYAVLIVAGGTAALVGLGTFVLVTLLWPVLAPAAVLALVLVAAAAVLVLRPWRIEAASSAGERFTSVVLGLPRAIRRRDLVSDFLTRGLRPGP